MAAIISFECSVLEYFALILATSGLKRFLTFINFYLSERKLILYLILKYGKKIPYKYFQL
jgi:hypothetical protein